MIIDEKFIHGKIVEYEKRYISMTTRSREMFERARRLLAGGVTYTIRFMEPYPIYIASGRGSKAIDVDGNEYDDYWMGHGAHILGHSPSFIVEAVNRASLNGTHLGFENPYAIEYAELLTKTIPSIEMIRFCNSGTEANMYAIRLARAYTRRRYIIKIEGGWHGGLDQLHTAVTPPFTGPESAGIPEDFIKYTISVPFNDLDSMEKVLKMYEIAAIIMEPVPGAGGCIEPLDGYLRGVRDLANRYGAMLIFDEVITGFRLSLGGAQEYFNVYPDITVLGKIVGGGYPGAGAFGGRREYMELLDHIKHPNPRERSFHGGTFTGNTITIIAGYTMIKYLYENRHLYEKFNNMWRGIAKRLDGICEEVDRICWITNVGSMIGIHFTKKRPINIREAYEQRIYEEIYKALHLYMRINRVLYMTQKMPHLMPSMIHTEEQAKKLIELFTEFVHELKKAIK